VEHNHHGNPLRCMVNNQHLLRSQPRMPVQVLTGEQTGYHDLGELTGITRVNSKNNHP
jgi:hypothetical protein